MDTTGYLFLSIIGLLFWILIIYSVIKSANETSRRDKIQMQNQQLLALLCERMGVNPEHIKMVQGEPKKEEIANSKMITP